MTSGVVPSAPPAAAAVAPPLTHHPAFGVAAVLLGAVISTLNLQQGAPLTDRSLADLSANFAALSNGPGEAAASGVGTLSTLLRRRANVLAFIDGFRIVACMLAGGMLLIALMRPPPPNLFTPPLLGR